MKQRRTRTTGAKKALYRKLMAEHEDWRMDAFELAVRGLVAAGLAKAAASVIATRVFKGIHIKSL